MEPDVTSIPRKYSLPIWTAAASGLRTSSSIYSLWEGHIRAVVGGVTVTSWSLKSHDEHQSSNHNKSYALTLFSPVEGSAGATLHTKVHILTSLHTNVVKIVLYMWR